MFTPVIYRPSARAALAIGILFAWLGSLAWLGGRELHRSDAETLSTEATSRLAPATTWYALYAGQIQVGHASITLDTLSPGYRIGESITVEEPSGDSLIAAMRRTDAWTGATLNVERVRSQFTRQGRESDWTITIAGDTVSAKFIGAAMTQGRAHLDAAPVIPAVLNFRLALDDALSADKSANATLLDSWPVAGGSARVVYEKDTTITYADSSAMGPDHAWHAAEIDSGRARAVIVNAPAGARRIWIDHRGTVMGRESALGLRWVRTDFDLSQSEFRRTLSGRAFAIRGAVPEITLFAPANHPDTDSRTRTFVVSHRDGSPVDPRLLEYLSGGRQMVHGDTIVISDTPLARGARDDTVADPAIQSGAGAIRTWRRQLPPVLGDSVHLTALFAAIRSQITVDTASTAPEDALGTLGHHRGRPDGVARLAVAVLRSAGIPARYVVGVAPVSGQLLGHAWVEVWDPATHGWMATDPVDGRFHASTALVRLMFAGSTRPDELLLQVANARFTELPARVGP